MSYNKMNRFQQSEMVGEIAFREVRSENPNILGEGKLKFTKEFTVYDAYIETKGEFKEVWIEIKVRNKVYPDYMLEGRKLKLLNAARAKREKEIGGKIRLIYLNFTPDGTYAWDIDKVVRRDKRRSVMARKCTAAASEKVNKSVYYLPTRLGLRIEYTIDKEQIIKNLENGN